MDDLLRNALITLRGMWNHRWYGIAAAAAACAASLVAVSLSPEYYEASARIFVNTDSILKPLMTGLTVQPNDEQRITMLSRVVISRPNVERLVQTVGLDAKATTKLQREDVIDGVMKRLKFTGTGRDNIYTLTFRDKDRVRARQAVDMLAGVFIDSSKGGKTDDTERAKRFIEEQISSYEKKLQEAEERLKEFRTRNLGMTPGEGRTDYFARMAETERVLNQARLELREAERSRDAFRRNLAEAENVAITPGAAPVPGAAMLGEIEGRIDSQRRTLDSLLQKYTDTHPQVVGTRRIIRDLEEQRAQIISARGAAAASGTPPPSSYNGPRASEQMRISLSQSEATVAALTARVAEYQGRYNQLKGSATLVPKLEAELAQLNRDYEVHKRNYETLVARRESANISSEMQSVAGFADFRLVDPPRVTPRPVFPNHAILFPLALIMSLLVGVGATFLAREMRPSFYDARGLREATGLPLLGTVSLNSGPDGARLGRRRALAFGGALGSLVTGYIACILIFELLIRPRF